MLSQSEIIWWRAMALGRVGRPISDVERFTPLTAFTRAAYRRGKERYQKERNRRSDLKILKSFRAEGWSLLGKRLSAALYGEAR